MNSITHIIAARKSVRSFTGESLSAAHSQARKSFIATLTFSFAAEGLKEPEDPEVPERARSARRTRSARKTRKA